MIGRVVVQDPNGGGYYECRRDYLRDWPVWFCGLCRDGLVADGFLAIGMACARCGAVVVAMRVSVAHPQDFVMADGRERPHSFGGDVPSDTGMDGAIPLPADDEWHPAFTDEGWAAQNRKINDLLMGRAG